VSEHHRQYLIQDNAFKYVSSSGCDEWVVNDVVNWKLIQLNKEISTIIHSGRLCCNWIQIWEL
jgi:hypothetical protein